MRRYWIKFAVSVILVLCLGTASYLYYLYHSFKTVVDEIYEPIKTLQVAAAEGISNESAKAAEEAIIEPPDVIENQKPFCLLAIGVDERKSDSGRSDTLVVLAVNPEKKSTLMFHIPRDTRTEIIGHGTVDKINHAYAFGGVEMSIRTVENFLDVPITYYVKDNMEGFVKLIDILDGVGVDNKFEFFYEGYTFKKGELNLDGKSALAYSRMRYDDPRGDLGRNERQRQVIRAVIQKTTNIGILPALPSILETIGDTVTTNVSFANIKELRNEYAEALQHIRTTEIKGTGMRMNGIYYYTVSDKEKARIRNLLKEQLEES